VTLYGPATASGAPSSGSVVLIISGVMPGGCASDGAANATSAAAEQTMIAFFMMFPPNR